MKNNQSHRICIYLTENQYKAYSLMKKFAKEQSTSANKILAKYIKEYMTNEIVKKTINENWKEDTK